MEILESFKAWSLKLQGKNMNGTMYDIFHAMNDLLSSLKNAKGHYSTSIESHSHHLQTSIDIAWVRLNKYV